jgi:hypothetical protein
MPHNVHTQPTEECPTMPDFDITKLDSLPDTDRARVEAELKKTLDRQLAIIDMPIRPVQSRSTFQEVLTRLSTDNEYRNKATADPTLLTTDYKMSLKELQALRQVAILSGADTKVVDRIRVDAISRAGTNLDSVDVSCCSCCCCCCGDTAVMVAG